MRNGYSKESIKGRYNELVAITDGSLTRDWPVGKEVPVVEAMQYMPLCPPPLVRKIRVHAPEHQHACFVPGRVQRPSDATKRERSNQRTRRAQPSLIRSVQHHGLTGIPRRGFDLE